VYTTDGDRIVIIASFAGGPKNPPWYHNLLANPEATVELGGQRFGSGRRRHLARSASGCSISRPNRCRFLPSMGKRPRGRYRSSCSRALTEHNTPVVTGASQGKQQEHQHRWSGDCCSTWKLGILSRRRLWAFTA
jgi:hypothetical protein